MKGSFLLTRPDHDFTTKYLYFWSEKILKETKNVGILTIDLAGKEANKKLFTKFIKKFDPCFVYINGHGNLNEVTGYENKPLVTFAVNEEILKNRVVYALSCQSAKRLGKSCVSCGTVSYLGYDEDFIFVFDEEKQNDPVNDETAGIFLQPSNDLVQSIVENKNTQEAFDCSQEGFTQNIVKFSLSSATPEEREMLPYLLWDREHQVCLGSKEAKCELITEKEFRKKQVIILIVLTIVSAVLIGILLANII